jgi:uncharacterized membrane protein (UPF0127 family)
MVNNVENVCVFNKTRQSFLGLSVRVADTHLSRLVGLVGKRTLRSEEGLWLIPSQGIHTIGVLFPIDVVYLDEGHHVIHLIENFGTFRIAPVRLQSSSVLELRIRTIYTSETEVGDELLICPVADMEIHWKAQQAREREMANAVANTKQPAVAGDKGAGWQQDQPPDQQSVLTWQSDSKAPHVHTVRSNLGGR